MRVVERSGFKYAGTFVAWKNPRHTRIAPVFNVDPETAKWDGSKANLAIGSRDDHTYQYCYADVRRTGRTPTWVPFWGQVAYRCQITIAPGTEDEETFSAWCLDVSRENVTIFQN